MTEKFKNILFFLQSGNTLAPTMMPIVQQPRRPLGRESFRQRNIQGCVPQNMVFRQDQPNLNIDNCFVLKSQLRRYFIHYFCIGIRTIDWQLGKYHSMAKANLNKIKKVLTYYHSTKLCIQEAQNLQKLFLWSTSSFTI